MPLYCSNTGSTALRDAEVQQPMTAAHLSLTRSFFAFSPKVAALSVDLFDRQFLGFHRTGLRNRHRAGDGMQNADGDFGVGHGQAGGVDLRGGESLRENLGWREHRGRR